MHTNIKYNFMTMTADDFTSTHFCPSWAIIHCSTHDIRHSVFATGQQYEQTEQAQ
jgi:hypothetical protein